MSMQQRRRFLKSAGVLLAVPYLESIAGASRDVVQPPKRMVTICTKLGLYGPSIYPSAPGPLSDETDYLSLLGDHFSDLTLFSGLSHEEQAGRLSHSSELTWLTSARNPGLDGFRNTISLDQLAAKQLGYTTRFPSLTLSTDGEASQSYSDSGVMIPAEFSPARLFQRLFIQGTAAQIAAEKQRLMVDRSILDGLVDQTESLMRRANGADRQRFEAYLESIRSAERHLLEQGAWLERPLPIVDAEQPQDVVNKADIIGRTRLMMEMIPLILQSDSSRVINLGIQVDHGVLRLDGVNQEHHSLSHHGQDPEKIRQLKLVESAIVSCFAELLASMKQQESDGQTLLDHTALLFGSNLGNANNHDYRNLPILLAGGGFRHGNFVAFDRGNNQPLCNLFLRMLSGMGLETERFGQSTGELDW